MCNPAAAGPTPPPASLAITGMMAAGMKGFLTLASAIQKYAFIRNVSGKCRICTGVEAITALQYNHDNLHWASYTHHCKCLFHGVPGNLQ
ncbi:hypothetical protein XENTR_v10008396 [Xenopus tropicalis]|nr:hypothetical protein XENTR_v10008396 [Xenopus tropicalis]